MWTLAYLAKREGKFGIKNHISSKCKKTKIFLILIWLTLKWESWVFILPIFPYQPMETKETLDNIHMAHGALYTEHLKNKSWKC